MKWLRFAFLLLAAAVIQSSALMNVISLTDMHIKPDLLLILMVYFAINCDSYDVIITSFAIGFAADITGTLIGPHIISFGIAGTALSYIRKVILLKHTRQQAMTIFVAGILTYLLAIILVKLKLSSATGDLFRAFAASAYSAILWFLLKWPVTTAGKWLGVGAHRFGKSPEKL
jgi:rod shape-determining protein MreD